MVCQEAVAPQIMKSKVSRGRRLAVATGCTLCLAAVALWMVLVGFVAALFKAWVLLRGLPKIFRARPCPVDEATRRPPGRARALVDAAESERSLIKR